MKISHQSGQFHTPWAAGSSANHDWDDDDDDDDHHDDDADDNMDPTGYRVDIDLT
jgi:hypothetical protein